VTPPTPAAAAAMLRSRPYWVLLAIAALIGIPVSALAYFFLDLVSELQQWIFSSLPAAVGFHGEPLWWPVPPLLLAGLLVAPTGSGPRARRGRRSCRGSSWPRWPPWPWAPCLAPRPR
jgi:H+/Cl- antiporter ClcA